MSKNIKYTKELLEEACKNSICTSDVLRYLDINVTGSSHRHIKSRIEYYNINISHFNLIEALKKNHSGGTKGRSLENILSLKDKTENSTILKKAVIQSGVIEECFICKIYSWNNKVLVLQLDHINGNRKDNRLENLRFLCPNCHSQTDTYAGKNSKYIKKPKQIFYCDCGNIKNKKSIKCKNCYLKSKAKNIPPKEILEKQVWEMSSVKLAELYNVSNVAISKWCKKYKIDKPEPGYWARKYAGKI